MDSITVREARRPRTRRTRKDAPAEARKGLGKGGRRRSQSAKSVETLSEHVVEIISD